jgi:signal recognition particle receptor subunit beta
VQINFGSRSVSCKIVYYGPGLSGKTTNIQKVHELTPADRKSDLTSIKTEGDRTLFFDFMSLDLGKVAGMDTRFQLYTVPGQVYYNATRKLVLQGADGVVFVADSSPDRMADNLDSWSNLQDNLAERGIDIKSMPVVIQWNKRDVPNAIPVAKLNEEINTLHAPTFEGVAVTGAGVLETLKCVCAMVCRTLNAKQMKAAGPAHTAAHATTTVTAAVAASAQSVSFAPRYTVGASATAVAEPPAPVTPVAPVAPAARPASVRVSEPKALSASAGAPVPPKAKPRELQAAAPKTPARAAASASPDRKIILVAAGVAATVAAALATAWLLGFL